MKHEKLGDLCDFLLSICPLTLIAVMIFLARCHPINP